MNEEPAARAGSMLPLDFAEMTVEGLDDETSPLLTVRVRCRLCDAVVSHRTWDVSGPAPSPGGHGEADALAMLEHLNEAHGHNWASD